MGRSFSSLRVSLLNTCNLSCSYCVSDNEQKKNSTNALSWQNLCSIIEKLEKNLNISTIRLTGGEPTIYKNIIPVIKYLKTNSKAQIKITTNGYLLKNVLENLDNNFPDAINISLDTLQEKTFYSLSKKKNIQKVLDAIEYALDCQIKIKINTVVIKNTNDTEINDLLVWAGKRNIPIRFLELMRMGHFFQNNKFESSFISQQEIISKISNQFNIKELGRLKNATSHDWETQEGYKFGVIANESVPFCNDCNRLRLDSYGNIYGCLSSNLPIDITKIADHFTLKKHLLEALSHKKETKFEGSELSMLKIGG